MEQFIMKFKCNNMTYEIKEASQKELNEKYKKDFPTFEDIICFGYTRYTEHIIVINSELNVEEKIRTLRHELTHCWLHNYGHTYSQYDDEDVCEIVASIYDFISDITHQYINSMIEKADILKEKQEQSESDVDG